MPDKNGNGNLWGIPTKVIEHSTTLVLLGVVLFGVYVLADRHLGRQSEVFTAIAETLRKDSEAIGSVLEVLKELRAAEATRNELNREYLNLLRETMNDIERRLRALESKKEGGT